MAEDALQNRYSSISDSVASKKRSKKNRPQSKLPQERSESKEVPSTEHTVASKKSGSHKFIELYSQEGQEKLVIKLPGSHPCDCQGSKHRLVNNCTICGRIVCEQEGSGPCYFCGSLVCSPEEQAILNSGDKKANELRRKLLFTEKSRTHGAKSAEKTAVEMNLSLNLIGEDLKRAMADKDRLLEFQKNSAVRTKVYDDQADYYSIENSQWLTKEQRETIRKRNAEELNKKKMAASILNQKITIDLVDRQVVQDDSATVRSALEDSMKCEDYLSRLSEAGLDVSFNGVESIKRLPRPMYSFRSGEEKRIIQSKNSLDKDPSDLSTSRVQDLGYKEMQDLGYCLSMHQPYASLLVCGIKKFEGRSWYIKHRGILWIASTAKHAQQSDIQEVESFYKRLYAGRLPAPFPEQYPTGCLLGCVNIDDCLTQEQYRSIYPFGESESPFVAVCSYPRKLPFNFPISGKHKIYKLDQQIHLAAKRAIDSGIRH